MATLEYTSIVFIPDGEESILESATTTAFQVLDVSDVDVYIEGQGEKTKLSDAGTEISGTQFKIRIRKSTDSMTVTTDLDELAGALVDIGLEDTKAVAKKTTRIQ